jgi:hypothetical protein
MYQASGYIHPYKGAEGRPARCRVRIYLPDNVRDAPALRRRYFCSGSLES